MYVRLAFAVAVHVDPDILLVDEVLAVGDEPFQRKCMDRIRGFQNDGPHDRARHPRPGPGRPSCATAPSCSTTGWSRPTVYPARRSGCCARSSSRPARRTSRRLAGRRHAWLRLAPGSSASRCWTAASRSPMPRPVGPVTVRVHVQRGPAAGGLGARVRHRDRERADDLRHQQPAARRAAWPRSSAAGRSTSRSPPSPSAKGSYTVHAAVADGEGVEVHRLVEGSSLAVQAGGREIGFVHLGASLSPTT